MIIMRCTKSISISQETSNRMEEKLNKEKLKGNTSAVCENAILKFLGYEPRADLIEQLKQEKVQIEKEIESVTIEEQQKTNAKTELINSKEFINEISVRICKDPKTAKGCCNLIKNKQGITFTIDEIIAESRNIHGDRFDPKPRKKIKPKN